MKKTLFLLIALACSMSTNAQVIKVMKGETVVATYLADQADEVLFEELKYEYVDLGLPSGTLWATFNVGATKPEENGYYFAWGEVEPKARYISNNYKPGEASNTKYDYYAGSRALVTEDDAARVKWGEEWCMPTNEQLNELMNSNYTTFAGTMINGKYGKLITSKSNGNSIFLPAAGYREDESLKNGGTHGYYWCTSLSYYGGVSMFISNNSSSSCGITGSEFGSYHGISIRPVRKK